MQENLTPLSDQARIDATTRSGRIKMLLLLLVCAAPVAASYFTFYVIKPSGGSTNYGALVVPQRPIPDTLLASETGQPAQALAKMIPNKWLFIAVDKAGQCAEACVEKLFMMRQVRVAQNTERFRVVPVWLITDDAPIDSRIQEAYGDAAAGGRFLRVKREDLANWLPAEDGHAIEDSLYLVDPQGHLMMRFPVKPDPKKVIKDLTKLLKWNPAGKSN